MGRARLLMRSYHQDYWYWESLELLRKYLLTSVVLAVAHDTLLQAGFRPARSLPCAHQPAQLVCQCRRQGPIFGTGGRRRGPSFGTGGERQAAAGPKDNRNWRKRAAKGRAFGTGEQSSAEGLGLSQADGRRLSGPPASGFSQHLAHALRRAARLTTRQVYLGMLVCVVSALLLARHQPYSPQAEKSGPLHSFFR